VKEQNCQYERLGSREGYNLSVRHINATSEIAERFSSKENIADIINELLAEKAIKQDEVSAIVSMLLLDKFSYTAKGHNILNPENSFVELTASVAEWNAVDLVLAYYHPDLGYMLINPKNTSQILDSFAKYEYVTIYAGSFTKQTDKKINELACNTIIDLLEGKKVKSPSNLLSGDCKYKQPKSIKETVAKKTNSKTEKKTKKSNTKAPEAFVAPVKVAMVGKAPVQALSEVTAKVTVSAAPRPGSKMTPKYAVPVTNELFHNGNVEAWKRIIESYKTKHPQLEVFVYYNGERITNLNSLFTWGKVKRGTCIEFAVSGEEITDVAKLQRYLKQGASSLFEAFLKGSVNSVLPLF